jgi:hypothetical protein
MMDSPNSVHATIGRTKSKQNAKEPDFEDARRCLRQSKQSSHATQASKLFLPSTMH